MRFVGSRAVDAPWIAPDEHLYGLVGRSLVHGDGFTVVGESVPYYSFLYPLFVGLAQLGTVGRDGLTVAQVAQALVMSATAIPVFFWARPLAGARLALLAATLTVLIPGLAYSALLMSEALYYPVAVVAVWALAACLRDPTLGRQLVFFAALGAALADAPAGGRPRRCARRCPRNPRGRGAFVRTVPSPPGLPGRARRREPPGSSGGSHRAAGTALGAYATLAEAEEYSIGDVASSIAWQTGAVVILTVGVPLVALGVLAWETAARSGGGRRRSRARRDGARVLPRYRHRGRRLRLSVHRAHHRASASVGRPAGVRRLRRLAGARYAAPAARHVDHHDRGGRVRAPPPRRADHDARPRPPTRSRRCRSSTCAARSRR